MKVVKKALNIGKITLKIEVADDLFYLADIISKGDTVISMTKRRVEIASRDDVQRAGRSDKKPVKLGVHVEDIEFDRNVDRLRISGKITSGPENVPSGDFHTLNLKPGMVVEVIKEEWATADFAILDESAKTIHTNLILVAIEEGLASVGALRNYGVRTLATVSDSISGKNEIEARANDEKKFFEDVLEVMKTDPPADRIVVAGPGFAKDGYFDYVKEKDKILAKKIVLESVSIGGERGLQEIAKRGIIEKIVKEWKVGEEIKSLTKMFTELQKETGLASYGFDEVRKNVELGAVEILMISNKLLREAKYDKDMKMDAMLKTLKAGAGKLVIVTGEHDLGKQLEGLGGIAALHRYKIQE